MSVRLFVCQFASTVVAFREEIQGNECKTYIIDISLIFIGKANGFLNVTKTSIGSFATNTVCSGPNVIRKYQRS